MGEGSVTCDVLREAWYCICSGLLDRFDGGNSLALLGPPHVYTANEKLDLRCPIEGVKKAVAFAQGTYERECGESEKVKTRIYEGIGREDSDGCGTKEGRGRPRKQAKKADNLAGGSCCRLEGSLRERRL